jgi:hypothetical protein
VIVFFLVFLPRAYVASESSEELDDDEEESPSSPERGDGNAEGAKLGKDKYVHYCWVVVLLRRRSYYPVRGKRKGMWIWR